MPRKLVPQRFVRAQFAQGEPKPHVVAAWRGLLDDAVRRRPLDLPGELLSEYFRERGRSRLGRLVNTANRAAEKFETFVPAGPSGATAAAQALFEASAHPYYHRLSHGDRGGRPQLIFVEPTLDNDRLQAVADLLRPVDHGDAGGHRWAAAIVEPIDDPAATREQSFGDSNELLLATLRQSAASAGGLAARSFVLGNAPDAALAAFSGNPFFDGLAIFTTALIGGDTVSLFKGAVWFHEEAKQSPAAECEAVRLADVVCGRPATLVVWHHALLPLARRFAAEISAADDDDATCIAHGCRIEVVAGYDPAVQRRLLRTPGARRVHLFSEVVRCDRIGAADDVRPAIGVPAPILLTEAYQAVRDAESAAAAVSHEIRLTRLNDQAIGELCAWFTAVIALCKSPT